MKKLMIAAAVAAMIGGAQAAEYTVWCDVNTRGEASYSYAVTNGAALFEPVEIDSLTTNIVSGTVTNKFTFKVNAVALDQLQIYTTKTKGGKFFCLNTEKNDIQTFYKPSAVSTRLDTDGAIYYDGEAWVSLEWNKNQQTAKFYDGVGEWPNFDGWTSFGNVTKDEYKTAISNYYATCAGQRLYKETAPMSFECFEDKGGKKVWAANGFVPAETKLVNRKGIETDETYGLNGLAWEYGQYDEKTGLVKDLKRANTTGGTVKLTTYKDEKALGTAIDAILKKFEKVGGKIEFKK